MMLNYNLWARYVPTLLILIPAIVYINLMIDIDSLLVSINKIVKYVGLNMTLGGLLLFFFSLLFRILSKSLIENKMFKKQALFPTTQFLLRNDKISIELKTNLIAKINKDFNINLVKSTSIKTVIDAVGLIRKRVGDGHLVLRRNIEYGFMRNLIIGTPLAILFCILIMIVKNEFGFYTLFGLYGFLALMILLFSRVILNYLAEQYAKQLFSEYLEGSK